MNFSEKTKPIYLLVSVFIFLSQSKAQPDTTHTNQATILAVSSVATAVSLSLFFDQTIHNRCSTFRAQSSIIRNTSSFITTIGNNYTVIAFVTGLGIYSYCTSDTLLLKTVTNGIISLAVTGGIGVFLKHLAGRERPTVATRDGGVWHGPFSYFIPSRRNGKTLHSFDSFPSGHAMSSFSIATVFSRYYDKKWVPITAYSLATVITLSRVTEGLHWFSDCIVGAAVGYTTTTITLNVLEKYTDVYVFPLITSNTLLLSVGMKI